MKTIKEYAQEHGKTVQAVYKQLKSKQNKEALNGHIFTEIVKGKRTMFLDPEAESILNQSSLSDKIVVQADLNSSRVKELEQQNQLLMLKVIDLQELLIKEKNKNLEYSENSQKYLMAKNELENLKRENESVVQENQLLKNELSIQRNKKWWQVLLHQKEKKI